MKSRFEEDNRIWSIMPMRAVMDRTLKERELRVLAALCCFTNRHGVCWPSMKALAEMIGYADNHPINDAMRELTKRKYVRRLRPKDYQETASGWKSNRYQVLWRGDEPLPSWEEVHIAKPLQLVEDQEDDHTNETGGLGDREPQTDTRASELCWAYLRAVQQATGQTRMFDNEIAHARRLALLDITADDVRAATLNVCDEALQRRAGVPALSDVARRFGGAQ